MKSSTELLSLLIPPNPGELGRRRTPPSCPASSDMPAPMLPESRRCVRWRTLPTHATLHPMEARTASRAPSGPVLECDASCSPLSRVGVFWVVGQPGVIHCRALYLFLVHCVFSFCSVNSITRNISYATFGTHAFPSDFVDSSIHLETEIPSNLSGIPSSPPQTKD